MVNGLMYNTQYEKVWFGVPKNTDGNIRFPITVLSSGISFSDIVHSPNNNEDYVFGNVIPTELVRDVRLNGDRPSKQIRQLMFDLIPKYGGLKDAPFKYGYTHTAIQALEEKIGACRERASVGAGIAEVNDVPYRIVGSENLAPDMETMRERILNYLGPYSLGRLQRINMPKYAFFTPQEMLNSPYPHFWLEVQEHGQWVTVDTVEWNPTTFFPFKSKSKDRFECKVESIDEIVDTQDIKSGPEDFEIELS